MNIAESFAQYLDDNSIATLGQDLYISNGPSTNKTAESIWWIVTSGGNKVTSMPSGGAVKAYQIDVYRRDRSYQRVYDDLHELEELLNCDGCTQLTGFDTMDIEATTFPIDNDLDNEDRKVGLLQVNLTIYKEC